MHVTNLFGAQRISRSDLMSVEAQSADLIVYFIPVMAFFTLLEMYFSKRLGHGKYHAKESFGSLIIGLGNVGLNLVFKATLILGAVYIYNLVPWRMSLNWWTLIPAFLIYDFCSYWAHRVSHVNRFFWATHVVHHTAEHYNLTVSFRLSWVQHLKILFFLPLAGAGFHPVIIFVINQAAILFQFWQHTEYIKKLHPIIENLIITPANHRVHHGSDDKYRDKNFGVVLVLWDKLFKTYQKEEERPTYGTTTKINKKIDPIYLNFHEFSDILHDIKRARTFREMLFFAFGKPSAIAEHKKLRTRTEWD